MIHQSYVGLTPTSEQLAQYYSNQAEHYERLKMASAVFPDLFYHYAEWQYYNQALAHRCMLQAFDLRKLSKKTFNVHQLLVELKRRSLLDSLQKGGFFFYARHGEATVGVDQLNLNFQDCSTQRNLSATGRRRAVIYGETIRRLGIPILTPVVSSPFCRNIETAALAFGRESIQVHPFWVDVYSLSGDLSPAEQERILDTLNSVLESPVPSERNKVIIAHSFPKGVGLGEIPDMGTVIVKPRGYGKGYEVVDQLSLEELID